MTGIVIEAGSGRLRPAPAGSGGLCGPLWAPGSPTGRLRPAPAGSGRLRPALWASMGPGERREWLQQEGRPSIPVIPVIPENFRMPAGRNAFLWAGMHS